MMEQPAPQEITDPQAVRLLAHPLRHRIAELMRAGPVSSTSLARALGESTGATSYHLRQLARYGFIEEIPERARGRERWWRFVPGDRRFPPFSRQGPEMREAMEEFTRLEFANELDRLASFHNARDRLGPWADALLFSYSTVTLTPEEVRPFFEDYIALLHRYKHAERAAGAADVARSDARTMHVRFLAFPEVRDTAVGEEGAT